MTVILGIDTSNYTSSLSVVDIDTVLSDRRQLLTVKNGMRGLQQSEAVFQHIKNLPLLMEKIKKDIKGLSIDAIGVSTKPRPCVESYMPVFKAGESFADFLSFYDNLPVVRFSHQEGHIEAGLHSTGFFPQKQFIALHLSGGTCEILKVHVKNCGFDVELIGMTEDISAGQFIDRIGVLMGLKFPCGRELDSLALQGNYKSCYIPPSSKCGIMSFSGPETAAERLVEKGIKKEDIAAAVLENISRTIIKSLKFCVEKANIFKDEACQEENNVLFVGGVSSSTYLKSRLTEGLRKDMIKLHFCKPEYSTDNSVGIALLCSKYIKSLRQSGIYQDRNQ